ncbi:hypothetical protein DFH07DRAFT_873058 [Mycena maculata]|uniref:Transmembrane protein n=1 Tax=Mycena maculata TaxID=230809 RepID=A0AAD7KHA3_9AGAR|nr:hypothetical protein DFH07DRAFT_873058 [Mycena maculata]
MLEYPITRAYPWPLFAPVAFGGAFIVLVFLTVINVALAGYDIVPGFDSNFNVTQSHWYDRFLPSVALTKPGSLCDPRLLGLGDTITTNNTLFQYTIAAIDIPNAGDSGFSYQGWTLDNCDITSLYVNGNAQTFVIDFTAVVFCKADALEIAQGNNYQVTARADWSESTLPGIYGQLLGVQKALKNTQVNKSMDAPGFVLNAITTTSAADFAERVFGLIDFTNGSFPSIISFAAQFPWCPASLGPDAPCAAQVPPLNITSMFEFSPTTGNASQYDATIPTLSTPIIDIDTSGIISNAVQVVYAAVRFDLGNRSPNNFLLNTSIIPDAIVRSFPQNASYMQTESYLYSVLVNDSYYSSTVTTAYDIPGLLPLTLPGPALLDGVYLCRFQRAKSPGTGFIAVLVATLSMFTAAWGRFLGITESTVKRRYPDANTCGHQEVNTVENGGIEEKERFID